MHNDLYCRQTGNYSKHPLQILYIFSVYLPLHVYQVLLFLFKNLLFKAVWKHFFLWRLLEYTMVTLIIGLFFNSLYPLHYLNKMILNYMGKDCKSAAPLEGPDSTIIYLSISYYVKHECTCWANKDFLHPLEEPDFPSCVLQ